MLGSHNLVKYLNNIEGIWTFDYSKYTKDVALAVEFLDAVINNTAYPLEDQRREAYAKRRMGIGVTGVANAIERLGHEYASKEFIDKLSSILTVLRDTAYATSARLAKEYGAFPLYDAEKYLAGKFIQTLPEEVKMLIRTFGISNSHLISIAPTGTISLCADNVSSGIEPVFTHEYDRKILTTDGEITETVQDYAYRVWGIKGKTALELTPDDHVRVLAAAQKFCDSAVSKTVNIGDEVTYEEFKNVYLQAYNAGAKGCTTFRASGKRLGILTAKSEIEQQEDGYEQEGIVGAAENVGASCTFDATTGRRTCE